MPTPSLDGGKNVTPRLESVFSIASKDALFEGRPFSIWLTVFADSPHFSASSLTPSLRAARAIRI